MAGIVSAFNKLANAAKSVATDSKKKRVPGQNTRTGAPAKKTVYEVPDFLPFAGLANTAMHVAEEQNYPVKVEKPSYNRQQNYPTNIQRPGTQSGSSSYGWRDYILKRTDPISKRYVSGQMVESENGNAFQYLMNGPEAIDPKTLPERLEKSKLKKAIEEQQKEAEAQVKLRRYEEVKLNRALESEDQFQIDVAAEREGALLGMEYAPASRYYTESSKKVDAMLEGEYLYGVSSEKAIQRWYDENTYTTKRINPETLEEEKVTRWKRNVTMMPFGTNKKGEKPNISKREWDYYWKANHARTVKQDNFARQAYDRNAMLADHNDTSEDTYNSNADIWTSFLGDVSEADSLGDVGRAVAQGVVNFNQFIDRYYLNPLKAGEFKIIGMNILNDLGETLDFIPRGVKAMISTQDGIYWNDTWLTKKDGTSFTSQKSWVYSGGKKKQKKLMELGAMDLLEGSVTSSRVAGAMAGRRAAVEKAIKEASLWDEFQKLQKEYNNRGQGQSIGEALKEAYTTHQNYDADTGSVIVDMGVEMVVDPTAILGGAAGSLVRSATKGAARTAIKKAAKEVGTEFAEKTISKASRRAIGDVVLSKSSDEMRSVIDNLTQDLIRKGTLKQESQEAFRDTLMKNINAEADRKAFTVVRAANKINQGLDVIDSTLLKSVFSAPYVSVKGTRFVGRKISEGVRSTDFFRNRAVRRVTKGIADHVTGDIDIMNAPEMLKRMNQETLADVDETFRTENFQRVHNKVQEHANKVDSIIMDGQDTKTLAEIESELDHYFEIATGGEYHSVSEYMDNLEQLAHNYPMQFDSTLATFKAQMDRYYDWKDNVRKVNNVEAVKKAESVLENAELDGSLITNVRQSLIDDLSTGTIQDKKLIEAIKDSSDQLVKLDINYQNVYDELQQLDLRRQLSGADDTVRRNELLEQAEGFRKAAKEEVQRIADHTVGDKVYYRKSPVLDKKIDDFVLKDDIVMDKRVRLSSASDLGKEFDTLANDWKSLGLVLDADSDDKWLQSLNRLFGSNKKVRPTVGQVNNVLTTAIQNIQEQLALGNTLPFSDDMVSKMKDLYQHTIQLKLSFEPGKSAEYVRYQQDKYIVFEKYLQNKAMRQLIDKGLDSTLKKQVLDATPEENREWVEKAFQELEQEARQFQVFNNFYRKLSYTKGPLSERIIASVLDSTFNRTWVNPERLMSAGTAEMDTLIEKINLNLDALYGTTSVSLDSFREVALDFDSDFYQRFGDEIKDVSIQERIQNILKGGHENPMDDVRVQMLQIILRDKDAIAYYNKLSRKQDVIFTDIETLGLNPDLHEITSIATKQWQELPENATLDEILTMIESDVGAKHLQVALPEDYIRMNVSNKILDINYKNDRSIPAGRELRIEKYIRRFGAEANGKTVTEKEILREFITDIDNSFLNRGEQVPVIVTHNNNGFDMNFMVRRFQNPNIQEFPAHIKNLSDLENFEDNTLTRLKALLDDVMLTKEQEDYIRDVVAAYASEMMKYSDKLEILHPGKMIQAYKNIFGSAEDDPLLKELTEFQNDALRAMNDTKGFIAVNPHKVYVEDLDSNEFMKFMKPEKGTIRSLMRDLHDFSGEDAITQFGYRKAFSTGDVAQYFDTTQRIAMKDMQRMQSFMKSCEVAINKRMRATDLLDGKLEEFQAVIRYARQAGEQLELWDDLYFLRYLKVPETLQEAYIAAQKCWDLITQISNYDEAMAYIRKGVPLQQVPESLRGTVYQLSLFGKDFDIKQQVSFETRSLLDDAKGMFHHQIFKDVQDPDLASRYLDDMVDKELDLEMLHHNMKSGADNFDAMSVWYHNSEFSDAKDLLISNAQHEVVDAFRYFSKLDEASRRQFIKESKALLNQRREAMTAQILDCVATSEEALISHLLFHNQILVVPKAGSRLHEAQVGKLMQLLQNDSKFLRADMTGDYVFVGIKKEWTDKLQVKNDSRYVKEETEMAFLGETGSYTAPKYQHIPIDETAISNPVLAKALADADESILRLSSGASAGSLGILHTMKKQREIYNNIPRSFRNEILDVDYTCNERFWHNANYDMSLLGDSEHCWKVRCQNDEDILLTAHQTIRESAKKAEANKLFIDSFFGEQNRLGIRSMFPKEMSDREIAKAFDKDSGMVCVQLAPANTETGFQVKQLEITGAASVRLADEAGAIIVPYEVYVEMAEQLNQSKVNNKFLKAYTRVLHAFKVGYLFSPGSWIRNYIDATIKSIGDTGDPTGVLANQMRAGKMLMAYKDASAKIGKLRGFNHRTDVDLERNWDSLGIDMTYEQYQFLDGWMNASVSGGESRATKAIKEKVEKRGNTNQALRFNKDDFDTIADDQIRFEQLPPEEVEKMFLKDRALVNSNMGLEEFMAIFTKQVVPDDARFLEYNRICEELLQQRVKSIRSLGERGDAAYNIIANSMLSPMSAVEEMIRLGEYLTLESQGYTKSQIFKKITDSQFNYDLKSSGTRWMEMVIPFYSFMSNNLVYWCKQVSENPRMLRMLEHIWGELSWDYTEQDRDEMASDYTLQNIMLSGNIQLGNTGLVLKVNPSFMDAFGWIYNGPTSVIEGIWSPLQYPVSAALNEMGADAWNIFDEYTVLQPGQEDLAVHLIDNWTTYAPGIGTLYNRYVEMSANYLRVLPEGGREGIEGVLVMIAPDVFGASADYNQNHYGSFADFQAALWEQGKWYNANTGKVEDLTTFNTVGLNAPYGSLDFETEVKPNKSVRQGLIFDMNKLAEDGSPGAFVPLSEYEPGGLNRDFDFSIPGEYDKYCALMKKKHGLVKDYNTKQWVKPEDRTKGMLNSKNLSYQERAYWHFSLFGEVYDQNQGKWVTAQNYIPGGLNSEDLNWQEVTALRLALHGEEWINGEWVKTQDPIVTFDMNQPSTSNTMQGIDRTGEAAETLLEELGIVSAVYADAAAKEPYTALDYIKDRSGKDSNGLRITGNPENDARVFERIMHKMGLGEAGFSGYANYFRRYGRGNNRRYWPSYRSYSSGNRRTVFTPRPRLTQTTPYRYSRSAYQGVRSGGRVYSTPYNYNDNRSGLKMATSNYPAYDDYYRQEYSYSYKYRNPKKGVADYPQTKLGIQRYARMRNENLTRELRLKQEYNISNMNSMRGVSVKNRLNQLKLHWWNR